MQLKEEPATIPALLPALDTGKTAAYDYVNRLEQAGLVVDVGTKDNSTVYGTREFTLTISIADEDIEARPDVVRVLAERTSNPVVDAPRPDDGPGHGAADADDAGRPEHDPKEAVPPVFCIRTERDPHGAGDGDPEGDDLARAGRNQQDRSDPRQDRQPGAEHVGPVDVTRL